MTQKAKHYLASRTDQFTIDPKTEGGYAGSLVGLGMIKRFTQNTDTGPILTNTYRITLDGKEWIKHQRR